MLVGDQDGLFASACNQYRASMNHVADWAREQELMDHAGEECVPRQVSLLEAHMNQPSRVALLQRRDGYDSERLEVGAELPPDYEPPLADLAKLLAGTADDGPPDWWGRLPWRTGEAGLKLTAPLSRVPAMLEAARGVAVRGSAGAGVLYAGLPAGPEVPTVVERLRGEATRAGGHLVVVTAPPEVRKVVDMWGPVGGLALMRRVKEQFDPGRRFAPGRFVGGI
jgi:FAD/FMN-containing dehydrogenase